MVFFCICKTYLISAERYKNVEADFLAVKKTDRIWISMKNMHNGLSIKNMSDLVLKKYMVHIRLERWTN